MRKALTTIAVDLMEASGNQDITYPESKFQSIVQEGVFIGLSLYTTKRISVDFRLNLRSERKNGKTLLEIRYPYVPRPELGRPSLGRGTDSCVAWGNFISVRLRRIIRTQSHRQIPLLRIYYYLLYHLFLAFDLFK